MSNVDGGDPLDPKTRMEIETNFAEERMAFFRWLLDAQPDHSDPMAMAFFAVDAAAEYDGAEVRRAWCATPSPASWPTPSPRSWPSGGAILLRNEQSCRVAKEPPSRSTEPSLSPSAAATSQHAELKPVGTSLQPTSFP